MKMIEQAAQHSASDIVKTARGWLGTPYVHQASQKQIGSDCLGLLRGVWRELYLAEPEIPPAYTPDWNERHWNRISGSEPLLEAARRHLIEREDIKMEEGDVIIFRVDMYGPAKHCGIYSDKDRFIHAYAGREVCEGWLNRWWYSRIAGVFQFPGVKSCHN